ncbi:hypothetical protein BGX23_007747 [Mortierella sp. AD031]|nr:hypothetical protein BGX23_007747 [Mortierella sp. AD031]
MYSIKELADRVDRYTKHIRFHEANEIRLTDILYYQPTNTDGTSSNDALLSEHELRCHLYEARVLVYLYSVALRDVIAVLRAQSPERVEAYGYVLSDHIKHLVARLLIEERLYNTTKDSTLANAHYVLKNKWLLYKYGQKFPAYIGYFSHPGDTDPGSKGLIDL